CASAASVFLWAKDIWKGRRDEVKTESSYLIPPPSSLIPSSVQDEKRHGVLALPGSVLLSGARVSF
ncbi:MAG TPA: hypothetical protein VJ715_11705, partial [Pyrinomonadaceae bacterium]|nr:hypothetical protein [Pyrinomonadaceae bacterium]